MAKRLTSFGQIQPPIRIAFFDLGGVVFSFYGGLEAMAQLFNAPLSQVKEYYFSRDDERCRREFDDEAIWIKIAALISFVRNDTSTKLVYVEKLVSSK